LEKLSIRFNARKNGPLLAIKEASTKLRSFQNFEVKLFIIEIEYEIERNFQNFNSNAIKVYNQVCYLIGSKETTKKL